MRVLKITEMKIFMLIIIFSISLFNGGVNGQSLTEFKKLVAEQLTEAFDRIIVIEKETKDLKSKNLNRPKKNTTNKKQK